MRSLRRVRIHLKEGPSIEGLLERRMRDSHYLLRLPAVLVAEGTDPQRTRDSDLAIIPLANVAFIEELR